VLTTGAGTHEDHWVEEIDSVVSRVFQVMLLRSCSVAEASTADAPDISATVRLSGGVEAQCIVEFPFIAAEKLTDAFLGSEEDNCWDDAMIEDAVGELCNMVAGGWKSRLGALDSACRLSTPIVSRTTTRWPDTRDATMRRTYTFDGSVFHVRLVLK
jgi:chemotaxis protein CheX